MMKVNPYWNFAQLLFGIKYVSGTFAYTFYIHFGFLNWDVFIEKRGAQ
jgi:hypothetical protein